MPFAALKAIGIPLMQFSSLLNPQTMPELHHIHHKQVSHLCIKKQNQNLDSFFYSTLFYLFNLCLRIITFDIKTSIDRSWMTFAKLKWQLCEMETIAHLLQYKRVVVHSLVPVINARIFQSCIFSVNLSLGCECLRWTPNYFFFFFFLNKEKKDKLIICKNNSQTVKNT